MLSSGGGGVGVGGAGGGGLDLGGLVDRDTADPISLASVVPRFIRQASAL